MPRSWLSLRARRGASRSSASATRRVQETTLRDALGAAPDPGRRLSDGILIQASVLARLAGIKLLRLEATVVLVPAEVSGSETTPRRTPPPRRVLPADTPAGRSLADAVRRIDEGAQLLANGRHDNR